ncbi:MAG: M1 family metallopeptidase [Flavobacteriales bacterium]|nr:M1 family metallopeptidase [Flavobacteriales bacterium]
MKKFLSMLLLAGLSFGTQAQTYWQQQVDQEISVRLDDGAHMLHAFGSFVYLNNSPNTLDTIWVHLWPNAYRDKSSALCQQLVSNNDFDLYFAKAEDRGFIDSLDFRSGDAKLTWGYHPKHADIGWIKLPAPLRTGESITISTPFRVKIPDGRFSRLGHTGQAYYCTQWFPKPAVFDATGWHAMPYLTEGEFYSEFGTFDVHITVPSNYVVGATGMLVDGAAEEAWMDSLSKQPLSIVMSEGGAAFPPSSKDLKTLHFRQDRVHDFAWFADKRFEVRRSSVTLPASGRTVTTQVLFTPRNGALWEKAVEYVNESVRLYSQWVGDYPYDRATAVDGTISAGGGMEYPMITIIGNTGDAMGLDNVIAHEVGHNWFYGILGSNEREHAWMDEGMNSFVELRYMRLRHRKGGLNIQLQGLTLSMGDTGDANRTLSEYGYLLNARRNLDQAVEGPSERFTQTNYGTMVYMKTALVMDHLMAYLGEETMDKCLHAYFEEWKFKHPQPADLRHVFERESGKDLGWVFEGFIGTDQKYDVKAVSLDLRTWEGGVERMHLGHRAKGPWAVPFPITGYAGTDSLGTVWAWNNGFGHKGRTEYTGLPWPNADRVRIDVGRRTLDIDRRNNGTDTKPQLKFLLGIEKSDRRTTYWTPTIGANGHDGFMAGLALYNTTFPSQRFEWVAAPMYGFKSGKLVGGARAEYHFDRLNSNAFQNIHLGLGTWGFSAAEEDEVASGFRKYTPCLRFDLKRNDAYAAAHSFGFRTVFVTQYGPGTVQGDNGPVTAEVNTDDLYNELRYDIQQKQGLHPYLITGTLLNHEAFTRASLDAKWSAIYDDRKHRITFRGFAGTFLSKNEDQLTRLMAWRLNWGSEDLLYDHVFVDRGQPDQVSGRQIAKDQGGFKTPTLQGSSTSWIAALNMELDMPFPLPLSIYGSWGAAPYTEVTAMGNVAKWDSYYEAGIGLRFVRDVAEVWFPLTVSQNIQDEYDFNKVQFGDRIRIVLALEKLDPTKALRNIMH